MRVAAAALALVPLVLSGSAPGRPDNPPVAPRLRWRLHPDALRPGLMLFVGLLSYSGFLAFLTLHASDVGIASSSRVFALFAVIVMATRIIGARIPDRLGALTTTRLSLGFTAAGMVVLGTWTSVAGVYVGASVTAMSPAAQCTRAMRSAAIDAPLVDMSVAASTGSLSAEGKGRQDFEWTVF